MSRPTLEEIVGFFTTGMLVKEFDMSRKRIKNRIDRGIFPPPTRVNTHGIRLFDRSWVEHAKLVLDCEAGRITPIQLEDLLEEKELVTS